MHNSPENLQDEVFLGEKIFPDDSLFTSGYTTFRVEIWREKAGKHKFITEVGNRAKHREFI